MIELVHAPISAPSEYHPDLGPERNFLPQLANLRIMSDDAGQVGEVVFYHADLTNGTAWLSIGFAPEHRRTAIPWQGVARALDWVFDAYELRQVYIEALEHLAAQFRRPVEDGYMIEVGRLPEAWWWEDRYEDMVNFVIRREDWEAASKRYHDWVYR